jgi:hypothetical protein
MFFPSRGDQIRSVTVPTVSPSWRAASFREISNGSASPSNSIPTSFRSTPRRPDRLERVLADVVGVLRLDQALQAHDLERVVRDRHVRAVVEDPGLDPARLRRRDRPDVVRPAGVHDPVPQVAAARRVAEVDLVADLGGPAGRLMTTGMPSSSVVSVQ